MGILPTHRNSCESTEVSFVNINLLGVIKSYETTVNLIAKNQFCLHVCIHAGQLYCLQARPIVTLPPSCFFDGEEGGVATLWDNSNIVESYSGVTSPLTFSFASYAYEMV